MSRAFLLLKMNSPISHLVDVLEKVRDSAQTFDFALKGNEAATRAALIDPVLRALGWDVANPERVLVEKTQTVQKKCLRVDYALMHDGSIKIIVEAKKLGGNLKEEFLQLVTYSFGLDVESLFVTDGLVWHHYLRLSSNNQNPIREFDLSTDNLPEIAAYFVQHMDAALISPETPKIDELTQRVEKLEKLLAAIKIKNSESRNITKSPVIPKAIATKTPVNNSAKGDNWYSLNGTAKVFNVKAIDTTVGALSSLANLSPQILPAIEKEMETQFAKRKIKVIKRRWLAQSREALYDDPKHWNKSVEIIPGWWLGTNYSNDSKRDMLATAMKIAKDFGIELDFHLI